MGIIMEGLRVVWVGGQVQVEFRTRAEVELMRLNGGVILTLISVLEVLWADGIESRAWIEGKCGATWSWGRKRNVQNVRERMGFLGLR